MCVSAGVFEPPVAELDVSELSEDEIARALAFYGLQRSAATDITQRSTALQQEEQDGNSKLSAAPLQHADL